MSYARFGLMILTSTVTMFVLMYLNTYAWEHLFFSETRVYMAMMMGASMAVIMLAYMLGMYANARLNLAPMTRADADRVLGAATGDRCTFERSRETDPVLWLEAAGEAAALKLNGVLGDRGFYGCAG